MTDWQEDLGAFLSQTEAGRVEAASGSPFGRFITAVVLPAFEALAQELEKYGRQVTVRHTSTSAGLLVSYDGDEEMTYRVQERMFPSGVLPYAEIRYHERKGLRLIRAESMFRSGAPDYALDDVTSDDVIANFLEQYKRRVKTG